MSAKKCGISPNVALEGEFMKCIWMMSGNLNYKLCDRSYDCESCPLDRALRLQKEIRSPKTSDTLSSLARQTRVTGTKVSDQSAVPTAIRGFRMAGDLFYHPSHFWARVEAGGQLRVGLDDFGQKILGRVYAVDLPAKNQQIHPDNPCLRFAYLAGEVPLAVPFPGVIDQVNERLDQQPSLVNREPYGQGWLAIVQPDRLSEGLRNMLYGQEATSWLPQEIDRLRHMVGDMVEECRPRIGETLQDGGLEVEDFTKLIGPAQHRQIVATFFRSKTQGRVGSMDSNQTTGQI
jgi:glycine cleavage system H lipoate-binding protein